MTLLTRLPMEGVTRSRIVNGCNVDELVSPPGPTGDPWVHIFCPACGWTRMIPDDLDRDLSLARSHRC